MKNNINFSKAMNIIHELDKDYEQLSDVPNSDKRLIAVRKLLGGKIEDDFLAKIKDQIVFMLKSGYPVDEISQLTKASIEDIEQLAKKKRLPIMERFRWVSEDNIYAVSYSDLRKFSDKPARKTFTNFSSLPEGSKYIVKTSLYRKTTLGVSDYRKMRINYERKAKVRN